MISSKFNDDWPWDTLSGFLQINSVKDLSESSLSKRSEDVPTTLQFGILDLVDNFHFSVFLEEALSRELFLKFSLHLLCVVGVLL
jgi:hypothetical protein